MKQNSRMFHMKERLLLRPQLSGVTALMLHHTVFILLLTCAGESSQPIVAMMGDDIVLPCQMERAVDASGLTVEWSRPDLDPRFVHLRRDSVELELEENPLYKGRTSLSTNRLKRGDVSLKLSKVKVSDEGTYRGFVPSGTPTDCVVQLAVGSVSSPDIKISKVSNGVLLVCKSKGWYPEPEVFWLDGEGNLLSAGPTETVRGPDDLYTVSSRVTVEKRHSNSFTCRVQQNSINQTREAKIDVPDELYLVQSNSAVRISICLAVCVVSICTVVFIVHRKGQQNTLKTMTSSNELQPLMDGEKLKTGSDKIHYLDNTKAKLDEDLQKTEGELKHVTQVITNLKEQKENLNKQREKLIALQQEEKILIKEKKERMEKSRKTGDKKKKEKYKKIKEYLEKTETEHENMLGQTNTLLKTTDDLINKMTERKGNLERDKEQICRNLKENKRLREETERKLQSEQAERLREETERKLQSETEKGTNQQPSSDSV
ncbi:butyrophilin subfamily 1 member A1-like [Sparus aurata]|uniref:Butyrophilin subfamily 1 member A1-like n=1 Tax=Sparus aurata TaxID=8175 RepID=A0A671UTL7_SPAAU|nr:butyrophilin subfamily 1 member A1-like [Sparus aurata]XP_030287347.1 butyrophilin subfamily 1 member A1-like [Sparus aurata]